MITTIITLPIYGQLNDLLLQTKELNDDFSLFLVSSKQETLTEDTKKMDFA